ncbi:helix-turn-helix domain-containing protein [Hymenobacter lucidus]|uniref:Helix-turn-helix domain-containing protein n=1 Tax=Hymenobacter lucidus TaxID=2880930 RepID=A0ABS8AYL8_9BACT|nr:helix-turn-helix domain-containing protein [Hymenobacter lucidus]
MVERIRILLQSRQLTPTQFADAIGVARPIVSHILSGRNKPSLEVVQKIIGAFPDLSLPWLLSGIEPMLAAAVAATGALPTTAPTQPTTGPEAVEAPIKRIRTVPAKAPAIAPATESEPVPAVEPLPLTEASVSTTAAEQATTVIPPISSPPTAKERPALGQDAAAMPSSLPLAALAAPGKKIRRIVIFYQDGTFSDYQPE